jgi:gas vesicle protein
MGIGVAAGIATALLVAPKRGAEMRRSLRAQADRALDRGVGLFHEGRRALTGRAPAGTAPETLSATLGEIAQMHSADELSSLEARS